MTATILIVDDSRMVRTLVRGALEAGGFNVVEAIHGAHALTQLDRQTPDLMITDVNMPEMDGLTLVERVRPQARFAHLPILMLTTETAEDLKQRGRQAGANGWMVKPFSPTQLRETVALVLERARSGALFAKKSGSSAGSDGRR